MAQERNGFVNLACPACDKGVIAPPEAAGLTVRCACGQEFAVPAARDSAPRKAPRVFSWARFNFVDLPWREMGPTGRAAFVVGLSTAVVAVAAAGVWMVAAFMMERVYPMDNLWPEYKSGEPGSWRVRSHFTVMRAAWNVLLVNGAVAGVGLVAALLNANRQAPPPHTKLSIGAAAIGVGFAVNAFFFLWLAFLS